MIEDVLAQPHQIADALWRIDAAGVPVREKSGGLVVCGMGGSAIGADLAWSALGAQARRPLRTVRGYALDAWTVPDTLVLCASYSGSTEETLACFEDAGRIGAARVVLTTGGPLAERARAEGVPVIGVPSGMQPRAAVIYMTLAALECAAACGAAPSLRDGIERSVAVLEALADDEEPATVAAALQGKLTVVHGAGLTFGPARRWKSQLNENAKMPAFVSELPEANHNEIEGWRRGLEQAPVAAVMLEARGLHPRVDTRFRILADALVEMGVPVVRVTARGEDPVAHVLSLVMLGDLVSVRLAELDETDPMTVADIEGFKAALG